MCVPAFCSRVRAAKVDEARRDKKMGSFMADEGEKKFKEFQHLYIVSKEQRHHAKRIHMLRSRSS